MSRAMSHREFDLLVFPTIYSYVPVFSRAKKIVMIHDIIPEKYPDLTVPRSAARFLWNTKVALGRWQADAIATVSDYSRRGILEHFGLTAERVFVVGEGSDPIFRVLEHAQLNEHLRAVGIPTAGRLIVYVGGFGPHKNLESLLAVFAKLSTRDEFRDIVLIMVGEYSKEVFHSAYETLKNKVYELGLSKRVIFTGYLADEDLVILLNLATVLVLPSLIEGFGLPAIEAAACGCPVVATTESPLSTLLGRGALYVDPTNPDELQSVLGHILVSEELREELRRAGIVAARELSWEAAAHQMISVFDRVVAQ
jgi:glycosyltransferase involved in cell wall biosynthesis